MYHHTGTVRGDVDVVIVGSGPIGSAFARVLSQERPRTRILLVDAGPQLTPIPGVHIKNIPDPEARLTAQLRSEGSGSDEGRESRLRALQAADAATTVARLGTAYVDPAPKDPSVTLPAAAMSTNVGGMGAHWTCACPHPYGRERIPFIPDSEWDELVEEARRLLDVRTDAFPRTRPGEAILRTLSRELDPELPAGRKVQPMPLACRVEPGGTLHWTGTDVVLGPLATEPPATFELRPETLCTRVVVEADRATGVVLIGRRTGKSYAVSANAVVLACDSFRTPQLLWASGVRPRALGHFLNDHVQILAAVRLDDDLVAAATADMRSGDVLDSRATERDPMVGVFWVPYADDAHPFHSQVMHWDMSPLALRGEGDGGHVVGIGALVGKAELRYEDRVTFSETEVDRFGLPRPSIAYELTERDLEHVARVRKEQDRAAAAFGSYAPGREPRVLPPGSSLHYQGTVRMSEDDDGESVCDAYARVWGARNLFVGGNGVIPTITAGNSTLTSVAVAVRSARMLASEL